MKRYQPIIAKYGNVTQAEMQENERGQYHLKADVDELKSLLRECIDDSGAEQFLGSDLLQRIELALQEER